MRSVLRVGLRFLLSFGLTPICHLASPYFMSGRRPAEVRYDWADVRTVRMNGRFLHYSPVFSLFNLGRRVLTLPSCRRLRRQGGTGQAQVPQQCAQSGDLQREESGVASAERVGVDV